MSENPHVPEATSRASVTIWTSGRRSAQWKVRISEGVNDDVVGEIVVRAVRAFRSVGDVLAATEPRPFRGEEPEAA